MVLKPQTNDLQSYLSSSAFIDFDRQIKGGIRELADETAPF